MAPSQSFTRRKRSKDRSRDRKPTFYDRKRIVVRPPAKITVYNDHLEIEKEQQSFTISFIYIYSIFLHLDVEIPLKDLLFLASKFRLFIIDSRGYLIGKVVGFEKK